MKKEYRISALILTCLMLISNFVFISCESDDDDKKSSDVELLSYGPMPIARGAELRFIGNNLDKITSIILPEGIEIPASQFTRRTPTLLALTVPQNAVEGIVILVHPKGTIETKTPIGYSEPISIEAFSPATIKPGAVLTITGDYLNLVGEVIFTDRIAVDSTQFTSQSRGEIKLVVPFEAETGIIAVSNAASNPIIVYSEDELNVVLPAFTAIAPNPVKAGTMLTITGTNLDLVTQVQLGGGKVINADDFEDHSATSIELMVPEDTKDGKVTLLPGSGVEVESGQELLMVIPVIASATPLTIKNGQDMTITGENLDLVVSVIFGGGVEGTIVSATETELVVTTPETAVNGTYTLTTRADKEVTGATVAFINPVFASFTPVECKPNTSVTVTGQNLDLTKEVIFTGNIKGKISAQSETSLTVTIPVGAQTGKITLVALNGTEVVSAADITILSNLPDITGFAESSARPGYILTIQGTNLSLIKELIFPGGIYATAYGFKTDTEIQVYVPLNVPFGYAAITMSTYEGEEGLTPEIFFGGTDPILYPNLVINDFDEEGHSLDWDNWGGISALMDDGNGVSGKYLKGNATLGEWDWKWVWGCNHDQLPKPAIDVAANYVFKIDVKIEGVINDDSNRFQFKFSGTESEWFKVGLDNGDGTWGTGNVWVTVTYELSDLNITGAIPGSGEWGLITQPPAGLDFRKISFDNFRFEPKN